MTKLKAENTRDGAASDRNRQSRKPNYREHGT